MTALTKKKSVSRGVGRSFTTLFFPHQSRKEGDMEKWFLVTGIAAHLLAIIVRFAAFVNSVGNMKLTPLKQPGT
jgi:hypothetical protein